MDLRFYIYQRCEQLREELRRREQRLAYQDALLIGLLHMLPPIGNTFPEKKRKRWLEAVEATLDMLYER